MVDGQAVVVPAARSRLEVLYDAHFPNALRVAYLMTGDRHLAEDLAQDAFVKVAGRFHDLRNADAFGAYLRRTVVNLSHGHFRRVRVERSYLAGERDRARRQEERFPDVEGRQEIVVALGRLPHRQRAAIVLRYLEDLSERQTADVMDCSVSAVKSMVNRGTVTLRRILEQEGPTRG